MDHSGQLASIDPCPFSSETLGTSVDLLTATTAALLSALLTLFKALFKNCYASKLSLAAWNCYASKVSLTAWNCAAMAPRLQSSLVAASPSTTSVQCSGTATYSSPTVVMLLGFNTAIS